MTLHFEDIGAFFDTDEFATNVLLGSSGSEVTIQAIFDNSHFAIDDTNAVISTTQPMLTCKSADVASAKQGTRVVVNSTAYKVDDIQPDGTGITILTLHKL
jgi:hypothetical protein